MIRNSVKPSRAEIIGGGIYLGISQQVLPLLLTLLVLIPGIGMSETGVNILFFLINFVTVVFLFRNFLWVTLLNVRRRISLILWYALLAILGNQVLSELIYALIMLLAPDFANVNDATINFMVQEQPQLMFLCTVILVPITEEVLYRGLIFRGLYDRSPVAAHVVSILVFAMIHVSGYVGLYDVNTLILCFLQYIPITYCLNFAYVHSGSILAPILVHMANNAMAMALMR